MPKKQTIHPYCKKCLQENNQHWYRKGSKVYFRDPEEIEDIQICNMICGFQADKKAEQLLTQADLDFAAFLSDSTKWATVEFDWKARWYQDYMLKCTAFRKVSRCGRRIGKTESICVKLIHYAYTHESVNILVIAPYKNQVGLIFDKLNEFIAKSDSLKSSVKENSKNPYRISFHNVSKIQGFTSGTRTGAKSTGIRGQDAHIIVVDEADYLSGADFEVILAIQASRPDVLVWASSTPTGKRDMFFRFCTEKNLGYKEFHFPSSASPAWTKQTERLEKAQYTEQGYLHEFEAEFGEEAEGVFLNKYVDECLEKYKYENMRPKSDCLYTMGVDWNSSGTGTVVIVTEWDNNLKDGAGAFRPVAKEIIGQSEFTQVKACERIIELNAKWNPTAIYVDQGYGHTQIEMLRKYGLENPETGLAHKLKGIYFGDTMEIRDPVTKQRVKKHMKPFMINLAVRRMEDRQLILPEMEDVKHGLVGQIRDYTVIRTTALGQPIYSDEDDHSLIAWALTILAATIEHSDMAKQNRISRVGIAGKFGQTESADIKQNKQLLSEEKRRNLAIVPRWGSERAFKQTTLKNNIEHQRQRSLGMKRRSVGDATKKKLSRFEKGRANF